MKTKSSNSLANNGRTAPKIPHSDGTDTDENEEQMRKLEDNLKRMKQKKQGSPDKKLKDSRTEPSKKSVTPEEAGDSTGSSDEDQG